MNDTKGLCADLIIGERNRLAEIRPSDRPDSPVPNVLQRLAAQWMRWRTVRRDEALLLKQSDYMLRDIGIGRAEIERAVRGRAGRGPGL